MASPLSRQEQLRQLIDAEQERMRQTFPTRRSSAVVALTRARDWRYLQLQDTLNVAVSDLSLYYSGWQKALQLCFGNLAEAFSGSPLVPDGVLDAWADQILLECDRLAAGEQILEYCETSYMRMQQSRQKDFFVWIASKKMPTEWRERTDLTWWTNALARTHEREMQELVAEKASIQRQLDAFAAQWQAGEAVYRTTPEIDDYYRRLGLLQVKNMACHLLYPDQTLLGGCTIELYRNVLVALISLALKHLDLCSAWIAQRPDYSLKALVASPHAVTALIDHVAETLAVESAAVRRVIDVYILDHENVTFHCSAAGMPAPPLLRLDERNLVWSLAGLLTEPFLFLTRELKRRYSYEYHTASHLHEAAFRQDLYQVFADKRFVKSASSVELKGVQGDLTTDVDALIFDRKTGTLALFELKSQDPFAYSRQERIRQRDYFYGAGKQVLACVQWLNRNGANALLTRLDAKLVKRLKVQKTCIFVLGRYLAHFFDGPEFDRRAAWGTWPQVLRLLNGASFGADEANPVQSLHNKLMKDTPLALTSSVHEIQQIMIEDRNIIIYPDFQTYKSHAG
jgi:hypothetical protein